MHAISETLVKCFKNGGKVLICGCGGLASESDHFAGELVGKYLKDRDPLPAISLTSNNAIITAVANDFGFEFVLQRQVKALVKEGDVVIGMSTSGLSQSIITGLAQARLINATTIDWPREGSSTPEIQENQIKLMHQVCKEVEGAMFP